MKIVWNRRIHASSGHLFVFYGLTFGRLGLGVLRYPG